jgi:osmotically-inducible protein OsmY
MARVREALESDPSLKEQQIEVRSRGHRGLELRGWVTTRSARSLAHRIARAASGELDVANRLLVRGEDDRFQTPIREDVPRPA